MSWKAFFFIILIALAGMFVYFKIQIAGDPDSGFNQTTRYQLGRYGVLRTLLGLHNPGDAKAEYLGDSSRLNIIWFKPDEEDVDQSVLDQFASLVSKYTGRSTQVVYGGPLGDGVVQLGALNGIRISSTTQSPSGGSDLLVYFVQDYSPRAGQELATTYLESGIVISLNATRTYLSAFPQDLDNYLLSSMLRGFGDQIGLQEQNTDSSCAMYSGTGSNGQPLEAFGQSTPQDFCQAEQQQISQLKLQY